jgi:ArsR family transcriptional regulator
MNSLLSAPLPAADEERVIQQLAALAQTSRLNIFRELIKVFDAAREDHGLAAGELALRMKLPPPTLSFHLKELTRAGLVSSEKKGRSVIYRVNRENIRSLIDFLLEDCCTQSC